MKSIIVLLSLLVTTSSYSQDFNVVGTWEGYKVIIGNPNKYELADSAIFQSILSMNPDSTFTLVTSGLEIVMGKFTAGPNNFMLSRLVGFEQYREFWDVRWPPGTSDPYTDTPDVIDILIPTHANVMHKKKKKVSIEQVYVLYRRIE